MSEKEWIEILEAVKIFKVSLSTLRRFIAKSKNDSVIIQKYKNKYLLNYRELEKEFEFNIQDTQRVANDNLKQQMEAFELELKGHDKQLINKLMEGQNKPFIRLPVFWATLGFIILIVIGVEIGYLYKKELIYVHIKEIGTIINNYERLINDKETLIQSKNKDIAEIKEQYQSVLNEVKSSYQKLTFKQERQINELSKKLEAAETEIAFKSKNISQETDIGLRVNYLGQGADTERGIQ
jgi:hypothetical protein